MTQLYSEKPELFKGRHFNHLLIIQAVLRIKYPYTELSFSSMPQLEERFATPRKMRAIWMVSRTASC
jgi:hypothetical protein